MTNKNSIDQLFHQALKYRGSEQYKRFFSFIAKFNHYSRYNSMIVYIQNPAVTFFGTKWFWKTKFKRQIKVDPRPLLILAPNGPMILAFDVFDTVGKQNPEEFLEEGIKKLFEVRGEFKKEYYEALNKYAMDLGIKVIIKPLNFFNAGAVTTIFAGKLEIYLREGHTDAQHFTTLCHELGHLLLGHTGHSILNAKNKKRELKLPKRQLSEMQRELEAETVSFLVCKGLVLETKSLEYLAGYLTDEKDWEGFSYELVVKVADKLSGIVGKLNKSEF